MKQIVLQNNKQVITSSQLVETDYIKCYIARKNGRYFIQETAARAGLSPRFMCFSNGAYTLDWIDQDVTNLTTLQKNSIIKQLIDKMLNNGYEVYQFDNLTEAIKEFGKL